MNVINEVTQVTFHIGTTMPIPAGRVVRILEEDGVLDVHIRCGEAKPELCAELNRMHRQILGSEGRWSQTWGDKDQEDRADGPTRGLGLAEVYWRIAKPDELPSGVICVPLEERDRFAWVIRYGAATPQLCWEMTEYLRRITGDGLWVQRWDGRIPRA